MEPNQETKDRIAAFLGEYKVLIDKFKVDFIAYPVYIPDGQGGFKTVVNQQAVDTTVPPQGTLSPEEFVPRA